MWEAKVRLETRYFPSHMKDVIRRKVVSVDANSKKEV